MLRLLLIVLLAATFVKETPAEESLTAEALMARVATNQDSSEKLRSQ